MKIVVGNDHRGVQFKQRLLSLVGDLGYEVVDAGTETCDSVDYPDIAAKVGKMVTQGEADRGILICGTGIGMAIAANKIPGIRAITCHDEVSAEMCRRHNNVNVLCLSEDLVGEQSVDRLVQIWLETEFEGGRHQRRIDKIAALEQECCDTIKSIKN